MSTIDRELASLVRQVSRSFYLTLRVLPGPIRPQIELAYLLARASDTIADTHLAPIGTRLGALRQFRSAIKDASAGYNAQVPDLGDLAEAQAGPVGQGSAAERMLLQMIDLALEALQHLHPGDRERIQEVLETITRGQEMDLLRFGLASEEHIVALETDEEMEEYTYYVAGCVGEFWTKMCRAHLFPRAELEDVAMLADAIRFGKGLQLVNILRDLPQDLRQGRCYIPSTRLASLGLSPRDLLNPDTIARFRPLYDTYLEEAEEQLAAGWEYTNTLPRREARVRLACAWPILIGVNTVSLLHVRNVLDGGQRVRISRAEIRSHILRSIIAYPFPSLWSRLYPAPGPKP